jgi:hypothetical protein
MRYQGCIPTITQFKLCSTRFHYYSTTTSHSHKHEDCLKYFIEISDIDAVAGEHPEYPDSFVRYGGISAKLNTKLSNLR